MQSRPLKLSGAYEVIFPVYSDHRGFLSTPFDENAFAQAGIDFKPVQSNLSYNTETGTLRGMHFQQDPHAQAKLVSCIAGRVLDVIVDCRPDSPTYGQYDSVELSLEKANAIFVPKGFAHGFQTLEGQTIVYYLMDSLYVPGAGGGYYYNDPAFNIDWPLPVSQISTADQNWASFNTTPSHTALKTSC